MTKENGETIAWADFDAWGKVRSPKGHDMNLAGVDNAVGFTSYTYDVVLDLHFAQARFYDADVRRFTQLAPVKDGVNWYAYCDNSLVIFVDSLGLWGKSYKQIKLRDGSSMWTESGNINEIRILEDLIYHQQEFMITGCSTSRQKVDELRYSFKNSLVVEAKESEYTRLRKALTSPNYWSESDITVPQRLLEVVKKKAKSTPYGIGERLDRTFEEALVIGISAGFVHAGGRAIDEINAGALTAKPAASQGTINLYRAECSSQMR